MKKYNFLQFPFSHAIVLSKKLQLGMIASIAIIVSLLAAGLIGAAPV